MQTRTNIALISLSLLGLVTAVNPAGSAEHVDVFNVVTLAHAVTSGWRDAFSVTTGFTSFELCEAARPGLTDDFIQFLEKQLEQPFKVESKCVKDDGEI